MTRLLLLMCLTGVLHPFTTIAGSAGARTTLSTSNTMDDTYPHTGKTLYLNILWHQHQPLYLDPGSDQLQGPWVRTHATKDYYDMTAALERFPDLHFTVNLTSSLLTQLQTYYVERLKPFYVRSRNRIDAKKYFAAFGGKTDPWIDIALTPASALGERDRKFLLTNVWNAFGISDIQIARFPEYQQLRDQWKTRGPESLSEQQLRELKFWFYLAHFDPDFLTARVKLASGMTIDLTDLVGREGDGTYRLHRPVTEDDCNRIVAETYKVCAAIVPLHKKLMYHPSRHTGQVEVITTPFYHPILPLVYDSDIARRCQPGDPMPSRYHFPEDAEAQVAKAVVEFKKFFGLHPNGMWPGEGSVSHDVMPVFSHQGIQWVATDQKILHNSSPSGQPCHYPYVVRREHGKDGIVIVFRETELSDKIGFTYQGWKGEDAADDFIQSILKYAPGEGEPDRLLTVILDGENAWEWYKHDHDGKEFQNALYRKLTNLHKTKQVITTTVTEYIRGNPRRGVPAHPVESLPSIEWLWPGSWINANYDTWIGEDEENRAWNYLLQARTDLGASGLKQPDPKAPAPRKGTKAWYSYRAWESLYAAEGSDWFWWYGTDQSAPAGDRPFDIAFITHLKNVYEFAALAGGKMPSREYTPIIREGASDSGARSQGTMAQSRTDGVTVVFRCDARDIYVRKSVYIAGNHPLLGSWTPNLIRLYDDGTHGDDKGDGIWTVELQFPPGTELEYKFTNSGAEGSWSPGEEFPGGNRKLTVTDQGGGKIVVLHRFGVHD